MIQQAKENKQDSSPMFLKKQMIYQKKERQVLQKTIRFSNLKLPQQIDYRAVKIYQIDHIHEIYTTNQDSVLPEMVLLHGFGGTSMTFIRFFKNLKDYYRIHALDALGVGHSSAGVFKNNFTYEQARKYYIDAIQAWRASLNIQQFVLVGHSFGGYLAACYTQQFPQRVSRLILLSPAGTTEKTPQQADQQLKSRYKNDGLRGKFFNLFAQKVYNMRIRPTKAMGSFFIGQRLIDRIIDVRMKLKFQEKEAWKSYFRQLSLKQSASQLGFYIIFEWPLKTKHTIQTILTRLNFERPIQFYYGELDWMDSKGAERLAQKHPNVKFNKISQADHQLIFDNPDQICYYILLRRSTLQLALQAKQYTTNKDKSMGSVVGNEIISSSSQRQVENISNQQIKQIRKQLINESKIRERKQKQNLLQILTNLKQSEGEIFPQSSSHKTTILSESLEGQKKQIVDIKNNRI